MFEASGRSWQVLVQAQKRDAGTAGFQIPRRTSPSTSPAVGSSIVITATFITFTITFILLSITDVPTMTTTCGSIPPTSYIQPRNSVEDNSIRTLH